MRKKQSKTRLPSLNALRAFEAAGRLGSLTAAADELFVTQGAVSRQVKDLEADLGVRLFVRRGPRLTLTAAGERLTRTTGAAFAMLADGVADVVARGDDAYVTLSVLPSVAAKFIAPRLGEFVRTHPEIDLRLATTRALTRFGRDGVDAALRYGPGEWPGVEAAPLASEWVTAVCAPDYARRLGLAAPTDLLRATLFPSDLPETWRTWFKAAGVADEPDRYGPLVEDDTSILQAVTEGQGAALGRSALIQDDLKAGRLVAPFDLWIPATYKYWFVTPVGADDARIVAVRRWLEGALRGLERVGGTDVQITGKKFKSGFNRNRFTGLGF